jgi:ATP-dependent helicase/nuclease subunit B
VQIRFLLGPAGSGKTFRCLAEAREALGASSAGLPLWLVAPKQTTYQLERQLLEDPAIPGYTRLQILSFERLAYAIFDQLRRPAPQTLDEEGRVMVLRSLLAKRRDSLRLFRASARLTGFAQELSALLREFQRNQLTPQSLSELAAGMEKDGALGSKLQDLATLFQDYLDWLQDHGLRDGDCLFAAATAALKEAQSSRPGASPAPFSATLPSHIEGKVRTDFGPWVEQLWVDGFIECSLQELELLAALMPFCGRATLTFCLDRLQPEKDSWLSSWSVVRRSFDECKRRLAAIDSAELQFELLPRQAERTRFRHPALIHLERAWAEPRPFTPAVGTADVTAQVEPADACDRRASALRSPPEQLSADTPRFPGATTPLRIVQCADPVSEATVAAREILRFVRSGGRYREVTVLVRNLADYHEPLQRIFARYEIPFFLDRRESVTHHPLAELSRGALRTAAFDWAPDDWFATLKTGLVGAKDAEIDALENEALARGWRGAVWRQPITITGNPALTDWVERVRTRLLPPFQRLALTIASCGKRPTGSELAAALRALWTDLKVEERLEEWAAADVPGSSLPASVHLTVWEQMNAWLANLELAFPDERLSMRDWLPILDAGLANLTVGVIPPALDQVLIGAIDRSRNPDVRLALVLAMNEGVFPAPQAATILLSDQELLELEKRDVVIGSAGRRHLGRERHYAYVACTRARERLILTYASQDASGGLLNPSPLLARVRKLLPSAPWERAPRTVDWRQAEHTSEVIGRLLRAQRGEGPPDVAREIGGWETLRTLPALASAIERLSHFQPQGPEERLLPELAARLYGPVLNTSVSRLEQFAACPFKFFVHSGLRAEERQRFELDRREQGSFQHDALALFHEELCREQKRWRDITPAEARERIKRIAEGLLAGYREGLLQATDASRFTARVLTESLQDFVETLVTWMRQQYKFDPVKTELPFGEDETAPAWKIPLDSGARLDLYGRIDRVDIYKDARTGSALCVVLDYKSSQKQLDSVLVANGLQLQLLAYLNVLRRWPNPAGLFGVAGLLPVGVFYINLKGKYSFEQNRFDALADPQSARKAAYRHAGRFDLRALPQLDARPDARQGDQFSYRLTNSGQLYKNSQEALSSAEFEALLDSVERTLGRMGREIFAGVAGVAPFRKGAVTACEQCDYRPICRIDPWAHPFRVLKRQ